MQCESRQLALNEKKTFLIDFGNTIVETGEELYADITINLSDMMLPNDDYIFVNGDMTRDLRNFLEEKNIIGETFTTVQYNMGRYDMAKVDFDVLKEYVRTQEIKRLTTLMKKEVDPLEQAKIAERIRNLRIGDN